MSLQKLKVYVINLDRRPDRWESAQKTLKRAGFMNIERVSAIDGKLIDSQQLKKLVHPSVYTMLGKARLNHEDLGSIGAVGCYLSHYNIWMQIIESNEPAIVAEDDMLCHPLLSEFEVAKNTQLMSPYDFVLLAGTVREPYLLPSARKPQGIYPYHGMFFSTHFYYLTPQGARFFSNSALPIVHQVDSFMSFKIKKHVDFRSAIHIPDIATQSDSTTDIQTMMTGHEYKFWIHMDKFPVVCMLLIGLLIGLVLILMAKLIQISIR